MTSTDRRNAPPSLSSVVQASLAAVALIGILLGPAVGVRSEVVGSDGRPESFTSEDYSTHGLRVTGGGTTGLASKPFSNDPLGLVAHFGVVPAVRHWRVFVCDTGTGYKLADPQRGIDSWGPTVAAWFDWMSGGAYVPTFSAAGVVSAGSTAKDNAAKAQACGNMAGSKLSAVEKKNGTGVIVLANITSPQGRPSGWGIGMSFKTTGSGEGTVVSPKDRVPYAVLTGSGMDNSEWGGRLIHEMGHALGWHHLGFAHLSNPYSFPGDVMSAAGRRPAHVLNRYRLGWVAPAKVAFHTQASQVVELGAPGRGASEMLVLADPDVVGKFYAVGVNPGRTWSKVAGIESAEGVDVVMIDQSLQSEHSAVYGSFCPTLKVEIGMCGLIGAETGVLAPKGTKDGAEFRLTPGMSMQVGAVTIEVIEKTASGYRLRVSGNPVPFWGRGYDLLNPPLFGDVPASHVFYSEVEALAGSGVTKGCNPPANTRFCPDEFVTRGQMAAFLVRALGLPPGSGTFSDTKGHLFAREIAALARAGITKGCNPPANTRFCPDEFVTRGQMAAFLARAPGLLR